MGRTISITPYALRLKSVPSGDAHQLDNLPDGSTFEQHLLGYLNLRSGARSVNTATKHALKVDSFHNEPNAVDGILQGGAFGFESELENIRTGNTHTRTVTDCEYLPFYFSLRTRAGQNEAILFLQRFGAFGVKGIFEDDFADYVASVIRDTRLSIAPLITDDYLEQVVGGNVKSITYIRYNVPTDVADAVGLEDHNEDNGTLEMTIKAHRDKFLAIPHWMRDIGHGWDGHHRLLEVNGVGYNDVRLKIDMGNGFKSVKLAELRNIRMSLDITDSVQLAPNGHPTAASMRATVEHLLPDIQRAIGWAR